MYIFLKKYYLALITFKSLSYTIYVLTLLSSIINTEGGGIAPMSLLTIDRDRGRKRGDSCALAITFKPHSLLVLDAKERWTSTHIEVTRSATSNGRLFEVEIWLGAQANQRTEAKANKGLRPITLSSSLVKGRGGRAPMQVDVIMSSIKANVK